MKTIIAVLILVAMSTGCARWNEEVAATRKRADERRALEAQEKIRLATPLTEEQKQASIQKEKDLTVCRYEATKATASGQRGYTVYSTIFNDVGDTFKEAELTTLCMRSKGWAG